MNSPQAACLTVTLLFPLSTPYASINDTLDIATRGKMLAIASDCIACHTDTSNNGAPYAGGYAMISPMGTIYATNITPSYSAGIGNYTKEQFSRAVREGIRGDGSPLYPAMPYTAYTKLSDGDIKALYAYFMHDITPIDKPPEHVTSLSFPFNMRFLMRFWNMLYLDDERFRPTEGMSAEWNEGAWLVEGPAHCGACHTPRTFMMAEDVSRPLSGTQFGSWYAPNITADPVEGIGGWDKAQLVEYLKTGRAIGKSQAAGPMAEVVEHSLQHLSDTQLHTIAVYLKSTKPISASKGFSQSITTYGAPFNVENELRGKNQPGMLDSLHTGEALYSGYCASCHQPDGGGSKNQVYPALYHNTATGSSNPSNLIAAILFGVDRKSGDQHAFMPSFGKGSYVGQLSDEDIAKIASFVYLKFGIPSVTVKSEQVAEIRRGGPLPLLARIQPYIVPVMAISVVVALFIIGWLIGRRRSSVRSTKKLKKGV